MFVRLFDLIVGRRGRIVGWGGGRACLTMIPYLYPHRTTTHPPTYNTHNPPTYQNPPTPTTPRLLHCTPGASAPPASTSPRSGAATPSRPSAPTATLLTTRACPSPTGASTGRGACQNACSRAACCLCFFFRLYIFLDLKNDRLVVARWIQSPLSISPPIVLWIFGRFCDAATH